MRTEERIKELRKKNNLTQKQLAEKVHVSSQVVSNWERGYTIPDSEDVKKLAEILNCSIDYLLGRDKNPDTSSKIDAAFESWLHDPKVDKFYKEFKESPDERREALLAVWEIIKKQDNQ